MGNSHTGNIQPTLDLEEHRSEANVSSKAVSMYGYLPNSNQPVRVSAIDNGDGTFSLLAGTSILDKYRPADFDNTSSVRYFGFTAQGGSWYIMREDTSANPTTLRYVKGSSSYPTNFTNRASLSYDYYDNVF